MLVKNRIKFKGLEANEEIIWFNKGLVVSKRIF